MSALWFRRRYFFCTVTSKSHAFEFLPKVPKYYLQNALKVLNVILTVQNHPFQSGLLRPSQVMNVFVMYNETKKSCFEDFGVPKVPKRWIKLK